MADTVDPHAVQSFALLSGASIPAIGLGTFGSDRFTLEDIANAVKFLVGEEASYITGHVLAVNGGMYM